MKKIINNKLFKILLFTFFITLCISFNNFVKAAYKDGNNIKINIGEKYKISTSSNVVKWTSSTSGKVSVDKTGNITGVVASYSPITITATLANGNTEEYYVTVLAKPFTSSSYTFNQNDSEYIYINNDGYDNVSFSIDDSSIAKIKNQSNSSVTLIGIKPGSTTLKVTTETGTYKTKITVNSTFYFNESEYNLQSGEDKYIYLSNGFSNYEWSIDNPAVASLELSSDYSMSSRKIVAKKSGTATITVKNNLGQIAKTKVRVYVPYSYLKFTKSYYSVYLGSTLKLSTQGTPSNASAKLYYEHYGYDYYSNQSYCTISSNGILTPKKAGTIIVRVWDENYNCYDECTVYIKAPYFDKKTYSIYKNKSTKIKLTGANSSTKWSSSNTSIATVDNKGNVRALKAGTVKITANTGGYKLSTTVVVSNPKLSKTSLKVGVGKTTTLKVKGGTGKVKWKSSNKKVAKVNSKGKIVTLKTGKATITATVSGVKLKCNVNVKKPSMSKSKTIIAKDSYRLKVNYYYGKVKWKSSNSNIVRVSASGKITGVNTGTATITATIKGGKKLKCKVKVKANKVSYYVNTNANDYSYGTPKCRLSKVYYDGNKVVANMWVINTRGSTAQKFNYITIQLRNFITGRTIAEKTFYNVKLNIAPYKSKKITFKFTGSNVKDKKSILNYGVSLSYRYYYTYKY